MPKFGTIVAKTLNNLQTTSATTTSPKAPSAATGLRPGGPGLPTTRSSLPRLAEAIEGSNPDTTDRSLEASLTSLIGSRPEPIWEDRGNETSGWDGVVMGFTMPPLDSETRARALGLAESSLMPMSASECIDLLVELKLLTKARPEQAVDQEAQLLLYGKKLAEYPADVVRKVLTTQPNILLWWPAWAELKERLDLYSQRRCRLIEALRNGKSSQTSSTSATSSTSPPVDPATLAKARAILEGYKARKRESENMVEPTPEEMAKRRQELIDQCEQSA